MLAMLSDILGFMIGMIAILNPFASATIYLDMVRDRSIEEQRKIARTSSIAVGVILFASVWAGEAFLKFFGISVPAFKVAGGLVVLSIGFNLLQGRSKSTPGSTDKQEAIAIVPLAMPIISGPGAISTVIAYVDHAQSYVFNALLSVSIFLLAFGLWLMLYFAQHISRAVGEEGLKLISRLMGLVLSAIAIQMLSSALIDLFPGWARLL